MKHLSYGLQWLGRLIICLAISSIWIWIAYPNANNHHHFELLVPGSQKLLADMGILLTAIVVALLLAPVISNNILRWIGIQARFLYIVILIGIGYYVYIILYPDMAHISSGLDNSDLSLSSLKQEIKTHRLAFWWIVIARALMPALIVLVPAFFLRGSRR